MTRCPAHHATSGIARCGRPRWRARAGGGELAAQRSPTRHAASTVALAATLAATPASASAALLRIHSRGPAVVLAQQALGVSADGDFGPLTRAAVESFQRATAWRSTA